MNFEKYSELQFDLTKLPFSKYGSNLSVSDCGIIDKGCLRLINSLRRWGNDNAFLIGFKYKGKSVTPRYRANVLCIDVEFQEAKACIYIREDNQLVINSLNFEISFIPYGKIDYHGIEFNDNHFEIIMGEKRCYATFKVFKGKGNLKGPSVILKQHKTEWKFIDKKSKFYVQPNDNGVINLLINISEEQIKTENIIIDKEKELNETKVSWLEFLKKIPSVSTEYECFAVTSWYNLWSSVIRKSNTFKYDAMLMSKKSMNALWSWDHCFNALAIKDSDFNFALNQFDLPFIYQSKTGALPDVFSHNTEIYYTITKPPVHGWTFTKLMESNPNIKIDTLDDIYGKLVSLTNWWLEYRDSDDDGIPDYPIGCDSGIDNATTFIDVGEYIESPDLPAYLILQMKTLCDIAAKLNKFDEVKYWDIKRKTLLEAFLKHSVKDGYFVSLKTRTHIYNKKSECFLNLMPLILGDELPLELRNNLVAKLKDRHLTKYGIATESPKNKRYYTPDGYWRGPIWAPTTYLLIDGLRRCGEKQLAKDIAMRYLNMVCNVAKGNYENFDALTGKGLRAQGYTWTASITIILMNELYSGKFN